MNAPTEENSMRFAPAMLLLTMASMCSKPPDDSNGDDSDSAVQTFAPDQGHWTTTPPTVSSDGCGFYERADTGSSSGGGFSLEMTTETSFTITTDPEEGLDSKFTSCTLSDHDFSCETFELLRHDYNAQGYDAVGIVSQTVTGVFSDELNLAASWSLDGVCEGDECEALIAATEVPFPCTSLLESTASHDM